LYLEDRFCFSPGEMVHSGGYAVEIARTELLGGLMIIDDITASDEERSARKNRDTLALAVEVRRDSPAGRRL
jgi:hypothetical protein